MNGTLNGWREGAEGRGGVIRVSEKGNGGEGVGFLSMDGSRSCGERRRHWRGTRTTMAPPVNCRNLLFSSIFARSVLFTG